MEHRPRIEMTVCQRALCLKSRALAQQPHFDATPLGIAQTYELVYKPAKNR
jgi:hypothetical protein